MLSETVLLERTGRVALLTLNRPEKLNALNYELIDRLLELLDGIEEDGTLGAVILTGAGDRAFSAGADIGEFSNTIRAGADAAIKVFVRRGHALTERLENFPKPVIAAVNGIAFGGGCEISEAAHMTIASERALLAKSEISIGMLPTFGGTQRLPRLTGRKRALELLLTGDPIPAATAFELGLVNRVVAHEDLLPAAHELAARVLRHSPVVIARLLAAVTRGLNMTIGEGLQVESEQFARAVPSHDLREGLNAWLERRRPNYVGA